MIIQTAHCPVCGSDKIRERVAQTAIAKVAYFVNGTPVRDWNDFHLENSRGIGFICSDCDLVFSDPMLKERPA